MATTTATQHQPWCTDHKGPEEGIGSSPGWCSREVRVGGDNGPLVAVDNAEGRLDIELWQANGDVTITPVEARAVAAALLEAAGLGEDPASMPGGTADVSEHVPSASAYGPGISGSVRQAAALTSLSETYIRDAVYKGELPARKVGNRVVILFDELRKWIESHEHVA